MKKIGMRNIKTSIAVFICIIVLRFFNIKFPFYACIAAIITMEKTIYNSFKVGKNRVIGTTFGALVGMIFSLILPGNPFFIAIGISLTIYICHSLGYKKSITIACIVFIAISTNLKGGSPISYSINRLMETVFGIMVAVLVNYFISPPNLRKQIYDSSSKIHKDLILLCGENFYNPNRENLSILYKHIKSLEQSISAYEEEYKSPSDNLNLKRYEEGIGLFYKLYIHLRIVENIKNKVSIPNETYEKINALANIPYKNSSTNEDENLKNVFKYHMDKISEILNTLNNINML